MTINIGKLELELTKKIAATTDSQDLLALSTAIKKLKNNAVDYINTYANLPAATTANAGKMYYVASEQAIYWSTGSANVAMTNAVGMRTLWSWGDNTTGQLGTGDTTAYSSPTTVVGGGTTWNKTGGGYTHNISIKTDGTLWTFGSNATGQLGTGNTTAYSSPITTAGGGTTWSVASGATFSSAAIKTDGTLWTWGYNVAGQLGTGNTTSYSSPVTVAGGGTNWCSVDAGGYHYISIKTDGTLWTWGDGGYGRLGTGSTTSYSSPVTTAGGGTNWCRVSGGYQHSSAIKTDGTLWIWGQNSLCQLGTGNTTAYSSPVTTVAGGTTWCSVNAGTYSSAAIKTDGTLWVWGFNTYGSLGTGNTTNYNSPVTTVAGGTNWCQVASGKRHKVSIKTDGTLWVWGLNSSSQLGTGNTTNYSSPVTTSGGGTNWCQVASGGYYSNALQSAIY